MALTDAQKERMHAHALWSQLTTKQQNFVTLFVDTRDATKAALGSYKCSNNKSAEQLGRVQLRNWKIRKMVAYMGGYDIEGSLVSRSEVLTLISDKLRSQGIEDDNFVKLLNIYTEMIGWQPRNRRGKATIDLPEDIDVTVRKIEQQRKKEEGNG